MKPSDATSYALQQARIALDASHHHFGAAQRLLAQQAAQDSRLMAGLAAPHLPALLAYALQQAQNLPVASTDIPRRKADVPYHGETERESRSMDTLIGRLSANFSDSSADSPNKISGNHEAAIRLLARAQARKRYG